jgi:hypothetical protein
VTAEEDAIVPKSTPAHHVVVAYRYLVKALLGRTPRIPADAARESARAAAKAKGVKSATALLLDLAKRLGI